MVYYQINLKKIKMRIYFYIIIILILSCKSTKDFDQDDSVEVIKFMGSFNDYPRDVDYSIFWNFPEEHARLKVTKSFNLPEKFIRLEKMDEDKSFEFLTYAFIYKNNNINDTIYADQTLRAFMKIDFKNGQSVESFYFDYNNEISEFLKIKYSFFNECW